MRFENLMMFLCEIIVLSFTIFNLDAVTSILRVLIVLKSIVFEQILSDIANTVYEYNIFRRRRSLYCWIKLL